MDQKILPADIKVEILKMNVKKVLLYESDNFRTIKTIFKKVCAKMYTRSSSSGAWAQTATIYCGI